MKEYPKTYRNTLLIASLACATVPTFGAGVVTNPSQASLQAAMATGGTVKLAFDGTIWLTNSLVVATNILCDATGYNVTISGSNAVQLFVVPQSVTFVLSNLTLASGLAQGAGGAISNAGTVQAIGCLFTNNGVTGEGANGWMDFGTVIPATGGQGGAIFNAGTLLVSNCTFVTNWAEGGGGYDAGAEDEPSAASSGAPGNGGAIYNANYAEIDNCLFRDNSAIGGLPGVYFPWTGMFYIYGYGSGAPGADSNGGATYNSSNMLIVDSTFTANNCLAGQGGSAAEAYSVNQSPSGYPGGAGGNAAGAGLFSASGTVSLVGTTFSGNSALAGGGGSGSDLSGMSGGGAGGAGGQAAGAGACLAGGTLSIVNCTVASNAAVAGMGGPGAAASWEGYPSGNGGNGGNAPGGGICVLRGSAYLLNATFAGNDCEGGHWGQGGGGSVPAPNGTNGLGEGCSVAEQTGSLTLLNSILSCSPGQTNIFGPIMDAGHNLNSDASDFLTNSTSFNGVDPKLGVLGNYGGPTPTIPLLPASIAIDHAAPNTFPLTDQRGYPRPFGPAPDIGAFEYWPAPPNSLTASITLNGMFDLIFWGNNGQSFSTLASTNLINWIAISTNTIAANNSFERFLPINDGPGLFFRAISH